MKGLSANRCQLPHIGMLVCHESAGHKSDINLAAVNEFQHFLGACCIDQFDVQAVGLSIAGENTGQLAPSRDLRSSATSDLVFSSVEMVVYDEEGSSSQQTTAHDGQKPVQMTLPQGRGFWHVDHNQPAQFVAMRRRIIRIAEFTVESESVVILSFDLLRSHTFQRLAARGAARASQGVKN